MEPNLMLCLGIVITSCLIILTVAVVIVLLQLWSLWRTIQSTIREKINPLLDNMNTTTAQVQEEMNRLKTLFDNTERFYKGFIDAILTGLHSILNKKKENKKEK